MNLPVANKYDPQNALELCRASASAYDEPALIMSKETDTRVIVVEDGQDLIIAFRGTADMRNWLTDIDVKMVNVGNGFKVHAGFRTAIFSVIESVAQKCANSPGRRIWLTGHSLGGALAILAADLLYQHGVTVSGIYTFGQPRVGNGAYRDAFNFHFLDRTFRIVNDVDIVPHVPWLCGRYRHCGHEVFYHRDAEAPIVDRPLIEYAADDVLTMITAWMSLYSIEQWLEDHKVQNYLSLL